jgi:hypothetical protein
MPPPSRAEAALCERRGMWEGLDFNGAAATKKITSVVRYKDV